MKEKENNENIGISSMFRSTINEKKESY